MSVKKEVLTPICPNRRTEQMTRKADGHLERGAAHTPFVFGLREGRTWSLI